MPQIPAVFARGGTSKGILLRSEDLPSSRSEWDAIFLAAMGSPDPSGRQLNGMGGGVSSLSKVCVVGPPTHPEADVDYLFAQVQIQVPRVDYSGNCGNMASAIGPYAYTQGLLAPGDGERMVRIHNVNTGKLMHSTFEVRDGEVTESGQLSIPGVSGSGSPIRLDFIDPGGAQTGKVLPDGARTTVLDVEGIGPIEVSLVDVANACVFVRAHDVGLTGVELPAAIESNAPAMEKLSAIRAAASVAMGLHSTTEAAREARLVPLIAMVATPQDYIALSGEAIPAQDFELAVRMISNGQPHRAIPMTGALCTAVAALLEGTVPHSVARAPRDPFRIGMPSGLLALTADVDGETVRSGSIYRTSRRLFSGILHY
jgi:2-methylaconitate cis-trans-isomerase PrpF